MSSGGQTPVTQQTTQTKDPWSAAQPYLTEAMASAGANYSANVGYQPYGGQTVADLDPNTLAGMNQIANTANAGQPAITSALSLSNQQLSNYGLSPEQQSLYSQLSTQENPYLQDILATNNRQIGDRINSSMSGAGRYGSGQHTDVMARALAESANPILAQDYATRQQQRQQMLDTGLQRAGNWATLTPALQQAQYLPGQALMGVGQVNDARAQQQLSDEIKYYNAMEAYPWEQLSRYNAIVGGAGGLGGTQITSSPLQQPSMLQSVLGGGAAGAGIGSIFGAPGAAVGAGAGSLLGLLSR